MKSLLLHVGLVAAMGATPVLGATSADLPTPQKRQEVLDLAEKLTRRLAPARAAADTPSPFNPPDFEKPDPAEVPAAGGGGGARSPAGAPAAPAPATDRGTLEALAARIAPSGVIQFRGGTRLMIANKAFEVGTRFTVEYEGQEYDLELVAINRTTFTLRYRQEEITRPINPAR